MTERQFEIFLLGVFLAIISTLAMTFRGIVLGPDFLDRVNDFSKDFQYILGIYRL